MCTLEIEINIKRKTKWILIKLKEYYYEKNDH